MQVKLVLFTFYLNGGLHAVSVWKTVRTDVKFLDGLVLKTESKPSFAFPHIPSHYLLTGFTASSNIYNSIYNISNKFSSNTKPNIINGLIRYNIILCI